MAREVKKPKGGRFLRGSKQWELANRKKKRKEDEGSDQVSETQTETT